MTSTTDVFGHVLNHEYDRTPTVNQKRLKLDGTTYATYNFDDASRLLNIVNASDSTATSFGYDNEDKVTERIYPNGVTTTYEYDNIDRLKRLKDASSSATLFDRQYSFIDANVDANRIETITELNNTRIFDYDSVDRLKTVTASNNQNESYNFDDAGNRTSSHRSNTYSYQPFNKLTASQTTQHGYDANGNMITKGEGSNFWRYTWDSENRMTMAATRKQTARYKYDALGRRVQRYLVGNKENTKYTYDGQDVLVDDDSGTQTKYLNGPGIDNKLRAQTGSSVNYFLTDHLGSTNGLADSAGSLTSQTAYDSFGNQTSGLSTRYGFTGRERDDFTGLMYYRARFYDPNLGRFISEDPIGLAGGINMFSYVGNSPLNGTDSMGLDAQFDEQRWRAQQDLINALAGPIEYGMGFGDTFLFGGPRYFRQWQGIDDPNLDCSVAYNAGGWTAVGVEVATGVVGIAKGGAKLLGRRGLKGLGTNPFKGKTPRDIDAMFRAKGFEPKGPDPMNGVGSYLNPKNGRGYHIDANHPPGKLPHVGVHRRRGSRKNLNPRDYNL